jgi:hypothetical protein
MLLVEQEENKGNPPDGKQSARYSGRRLKKVDKDSKSAVNTPQGKQHRANGKPPADPKPEHDADQT